MARRFDDVVELARELERRGMSRRHVLALGALLGIAAAALTAGLEAASGAVTAAPARQGDSIFDPQAGAEGPWPQAAVPEPTEKVTLAISHAWDATFFKRQQQFDALFTERHPNIEIKAENTPFADYLQKYTAQAAGGTLPDIMYCQFAWAQQFIGQGLFQRLDDYIAGQPDFNLDDFVPPSLVSYRNEEGLYGIPYDEGPGMLYFNRDLFDKAGIAPPDDTWTLDTVKEAALKLTSGEGATKTFGLAPLPTPGAGTLAPAYLFPFGAAYVNEPEETTCRLTEPAAVEAMTWWDELRAAGAVPTPDDVRNVAWPAFQFGNIGMFLEGTWATPPIRENAKFNWEMALWPKGPQAHATFSAGSAYMITTGTENADAAWIYLNDYLSTAGQRYMWALTGRGSPARLSAWPAYLDSEFAPAGAPLAQQALTSIASHEILDKPTGPRVTQAAQAIWDEVIAGSLEVEPALQQICQAIDPILAQNAS